MPFRRWLLNCLLALAVAAIVLPFPSLARAQEGCAPLEYFTPLADRFPVFRILGGDQLLRAIALFNEQTNQTEDWLSAYLVIRQDGWGFLLVGGSGTVCGFLTAEPDAIEELLKRIDGQTV